MYLLTNWILSNFMLFKGFKSVFGYFSDPAKSDYAIYILGGGVALFRKKTKKNQL